MEKLDPKSFWIFFFRFFFVGLFFIIMLISLSRAIILLEQYEINFTWLMIFILILIFIWIFGSYGWAKLTYRFYRYELTDEGFRKEKGVIWKKYTTIPYDRIQNIDIHRGILARILGLSDIHIQTAGMSVSNSGYGLGSESEGRLPGLSKKIAEELRNELIQRTRQSKNQGL